MSNIDRRYKALRELETRFGKFTDAEMVIYHFGTHNDDLIGNNAAAELAALREIARLATVIRTRYPGLLAVMWENDAEGSRKLPYMREKLDAALAVLTQKGQTK